MLFEPQREIDIEAALEKIRDNLSQEGPLRRWGAVQLNKFGLQCGSRLGMKRDFRQELIDLTCSSAFGQNNTVEETSLLNIPISLCVNLRKPA